MNGEHYKDNHFYLFMGSSILYAERDKKGKQIIRNHRGETYDSKNIATCLVNPITNPKETLKNLEEEKVTLNKKIKFMKEKMGVKND